MFHFLIVAREKRGIFYKPDRRIAAQFSRLFALIAQESSASGSGGEAVRVQQVRATVRGAMHREM